MYTYSAAFRFIGFARFFGQGVSRWCCKGIDGIPARSQAAAGFLFLFWKGW